MGRYFFAVLIAITHTQYYIGFVGCIQFSSYLCVLRFVPIPAH